MSFDPADKIALFALAASALFSYPCSASDQLPAASAQNIQQSVDQLSPPPVPERNLPLLKDTLKITAENMSYASKPSLSWRHKTSKLTLDKFRNNPPAGTLLRIYPTTYAEVFDILAAALRSCGFEPSCVNSKAGELLAHDKSTGISLVFAIWENTNKNIVVSAGVEKGNPTNASKSAIAVLDKLANLIDSRGKI